MNLIDIGALEVGSEEILCEDENALCLSINKEETKKALSPTINSAKNYLLSKRLTIRILSKY